MSVPGSLSVAHRDLVYAGRTTLRFGLFNVPPSAIGTVSRLE